MKYARFKRYSLAIIAALLCSTAKALTESQTQLLQNDEIWSTFQVRQNLRYIMKEAVKSPYSNLFDFMPLKIGKDDEHLKVINRSLLAFPRLEFNLEILSQIKKSSDFEVQDFLYSYFENKLDSEKRKHELSLLQLTLSNQQQCLILHRKSISSSDLNFLSQAGVSNYTFDKYRLLGRGFCFENLANILKESLQKNRNSRQKQILEMTFETLSQNEIFINFFNKPGVVGVYTPGDNIVSISTPSQFDLSTLIHETAHANFNIFFHELFNYMNQNKFTLPPEFLSEPDEKLVTVANLERSPFLNLLNEFQAWKYEDLMSDQPQDNNKLVNIILTYYGNGMKKDVHDLFRRDWANIQNPEEINSKIKQRIVEYNLVSHNSLVSQSNDPVKSNNKNLTGQGSNPHLSIAEIIQSLADLNSDFSENLQTLETYFNIAGIRQLPRAESTSSQAKSILNKIDAHLSHFLMTQKNIYHLKNLAYFLSKYVLPNEIPNTFALLTQALRTPADSPSAKLVRITFFPDSYSAKTNIEWPMTLISAVNPSSVDSQYHEVIANFLRIGAGIYLTPYIENGSNEFTEMQNCSAFEHQLNDIPQSKLKTYETSLTYLKFFLKKGADKTRQAAKFAIKSEPAFKCKINDINF